MHWSSSFVTLVLLLAATNASSQSDLKQCEEKEKTLALLELAKDSISKAHKLLPNCGETDNSSYVNKSECGQKEKAGAFLEVALELIEESKLNFPDCDVPNLDEEPDVKPSVYPTAADCLEVLKQGFTKSGRYTILPRISDPAKSETRDVYCDMDTDGGGWTVIQRRGDFSPQEDFFRKWNEYKVGFGDIDRDFWLGNDFIHLLSNQAENSSIRFDMKSEDGKVAYAFYKEFRIQDEGNKYKLWIDKYQGTAGDSMKTVNNMKFSTVDQQNDLTTGETCAQFRSAGWWFNSCGACNPNGLHQRGKKSSKAIIWKTFKDLHNLAEMEIKLRRINSV